VVIGAELDREDHGSIPTTATVKGLKPLYIRIDPPNHTKLVLKEKKNTTKLVHDSMNSAFDLLKNNELI
jgi:hypothetical protein